MARLVLDSGAIIALSIGNERVRGYLDRAYKSSARVIIPAVVITETTRGNARDAATNRLFHELSAPFANVTSDVARIAAGLLGKYEEAFKYMGDHLEKRGSATVDALIAAECISSNEATILVTCDADDLGLMLQGHDIRIWPV